MSMSLSVQQMLALILVLPWFAILVGLYWVYPREPRTPARRLFDVASILVALALFVVTIRWGHAHAVPTGTAGNIWRQVLATTSGYAVFLAVMVAAWYVRRAWLRSL